MKKILFFIGSLLLSVSATYAQSQDWRGGYEELLDEPSGIATGTEGETFWRHSDTKGYNLIQIGYVSGASGGGYSEEVTGGNGFGVGYKRGINLTKGRLPLFIEPGIDFRYISASMVYHGWYDNYYNNEHNGEMNIPLDFAYKLKAGDFGITPVTGPQFSIEFVYGNPMFRWNFGARLAYKRLSLGYLYSAVVTGKSTGIHSLGLGIQF